MLAALIAGSGLCFVHASHQFPLSKEICGTALFKVHSLSLKKSSFGKRWTYRGTVLAFLSTSVPSYPFFSTAIPCMIHLPYSSKEPPQANRSYLISGILKQIAPYEYCLRPAKSHEWRPLEGTWSYAEARYQFKKTTKWWIQDNIRGKEEAALLAGLATGEFDDRLMQYEFGRFGLQHIMAVSGFHFSIIAVILSIFLRLFIQRQAVTLLLIFFLSAYFLFLGFSASILRSWIMALISLAGLLLHKRSTGLNSLGVALLALLCLDPLEVTRLGFQFSFLITAAILLFYPLCDQQLQQIFAKRSLSEMVEMNRLNQHGYCILTLFRQAVALTGAVNLVAFPLLLYYFQKFPLLSLFYNLFFPFLISISMLFLLVGFLFFFLPPVATAIHAVNTLYTHWALSFTHHFPISLDCVFQCPPFSVEPLIFYLTLIFSLGIYLTHLTRRERIWAEPKFSL